MARQHGLLSEPTPASAAGIPAAHRRYALLILLMVPFGFATYLTPATRLALAAFIVPAFVGGVFIAPSFALNQGLVGAYAVGGFGPAAVHPEQQRPGIWATNDRRGQRSAPGPGMALSPCGMPWWGCRCSMSGRRFITSWPGGRCRPTWPGPRPRRRLTDRGRYPSCCEGGEAVSASRRCIERYIRRLSHSMNLGDRRFSHHSSFQPPGTIMIAALRATALSACRANSAGAT